MTDPEYSKITIVVETGDTRREIVANVVRDVVFETVYPEPIFDPWRPVGTEMPEPEQLPILVFSFKPFKDEQGAVYTVSIIPPPAEEVKDELEV